MLRVPPRRRGSSLAPGVRAEAGPARGRNGLLSCTKSGLPTSPDAKEEAALSKLPDGTMIERRGRPYAVRGDQLLPWSFSGYGKSEARSLERVRVLTPPSSVAALAAGYRPLWADELKNGTRPQ